MTNTTECVTDSLIESINKHKRIDLSKCKDDRKTEDLKRGDSVAMLFFPDQDYVAGKLEIIGGKLGIPIGKEAVGHMEYAYHVVKLNKRCPK